MTTTIMTSMMVKPLLLLMKPPFLDDGC